LSDTVHLSSSPPNMQRGRRKKGSFFLKFLPATLSPGAHRPDTMADHPPRTCQKAGEGGRALAVAPNGRPAGCSPCSTAKSHSLASINNNQHSSNEGKRRKQAEKRRKQTGERSEQTGRKEKRKKTEEREGRDRTKEREGREKKKTEKRNGKRGRINPKTTEKSKPRKRREREERRERTKPSETAAAPPGVAVHEQVAATSLRHSTARNAGSHRHSAPGNFSSPTLAFIFSFPSLHAERVAFCMQGWGENNSPRPFWLGPGGSWPSPVFWAGSGPEENISVLGRDRPNPFWAEIGPTILG